MKFLMACGSLTTFLLVVLFNAINTPFVHAAQLGLGDSFETDSKLRMDLNTEMAQSNVCEEEPVISLEALQESLGPNLMVDSSQSGCFKTIYILGIPVTVPC